MREIKFRGKAKDNDKWVYGDLIKLADSHIIITVHEYDVLSEEEMKPFALAYKADEFEIINEDTIGQYTGMKDVNGKEIYEDDVLSNTQNVKYIVLYDNSQAAFILKPINEFVDKMLNKNICSNMKIIGNVFDNIELLK